MPERLPKRLSEIGDDAFRLSRGLLLIGVSYVAPVVREMSPKLSRFWQDDAGVQIGPDWFLDNSVTTNE